MSVILVLIPLSIVCAAGFLAAFIWAVRSGQYEDTRTPSMRLLLDDSVKKTVAQVSKPADLSRLGSGERDCRSAAEARSNVPSERERVSQSPISKSADGSICDASSHAQAPADLAICDTADLEVGATKAGTPQPPSPH